MTTRTKAKDDEILILALVGAIFTFTLIGLDIWYSSYEIMGDAFRWIMYGGHFVLALCWITVFANWKDPAYDKWRGWAIILAVVLSLTVGIHHATDKENQQVIIDSKENAAKP